MLLCVLLPAAVLASMEKAADWQLANPAHAPATDWVQGAFYTGLSALDGLEPHGRFHAALLKIGEGNDWKPGSRIYHADDLCVGQTYLEMYLRDRDPRMLAGVRERCDYILAHPKGGSLEFSPEEKKNGYHWSWCDSLFMAPPVWVRLYAATGNRDYLDYATSQWWKTSDFLYDPSEHLYFRDGTYFQKREQNGKKIFWSRGNGWVMAGLARVLEYLPADDPSRPRFERQFREMAARIVELQQPDGLWRVSLLDPEKFPSKETSGTGFYCFALAWGVNHGLLDRSTYEPAALKAWDALTSCLTPDGKLTYVQPIGAAPALLPADSTLPFGVGAFLLAGSEIYQLAQK